MNFPEHIAQASTPRTEKVCVKNKDLSSLYLSQDLYDHARQLERQLIWLSEVVEKLPPRLEHHHDAINRSHNCAACKFLFALNEYKQGTKEI